MATQTSTRKRGAVPRVQDSLETTVVPKLSEAPNVEAMKVQTMVDMVAAIHDQGMHLDPNSGDEMRWIAEDLKVPFLVVWLAENRQMDMLCDPDLDDLIAGIEWIRAHNVPLDLLRHTAPRDAKWRADLASTDEVSAEKEAQKRVDGLAIHFMDRAARAAKAKGFDVDGWMRARRSLGVFHD
jgi:hypothetical protein